jgi:hypothetical protein
MKIELGLRACALIVAFSILVAGCAPVTNQGVSNETAEPAPTSTPSAAPTVSLDDLDPELVRQIAFQEVRKALLNSKSGADEVTHIYDKKINRPLVDKATAQIPKMAGFFSDVAQVENYKIIWTVKGGSKNLQSILCKEANFCETKSPQEYCNMGELQYFHVFCESEPNEANYLFPIFHAYVHIQQYAVAGDNHMPTWFGEGTASYFEGHFSGLYFSGPEYSTFGNGTSNLIRQLYENQSIVKFEDPATKKNVIDALVASSTRIPEFGGWQEAQLGYYLGFVAVEALIASYGLEKFNDFWRKTRNEDFYQAFENSFGVSTNNFYRKLAPYAVEMMKRGG